MGWFFGFKLHVIINHKGELIRTQVETEAGMKTVSETQEHTKILSRQSHSGQA